LDFQLTDWRPPRTVDLSDGRITVPNLHHIVSEQSVREEDPEDILEKQSTEQYGGYTEVRKADNRDDQAA